MSNESQENGGMIDFTDYDGEYQAGVVIGKDGEQIDLDELQDEAPPSGIPWFAKLAFLLLCGGMGFIGYKIISHKPPKKVEKRKVVKVDKVYETTLKLLERTRQKDFKPLYNCWVRLSRHGVTPYITAKNVSKTCPTFTLGGGAELRPGCKIKEEKKEEPKKKRRRRRRRKAKKAPKPAPKKAAAPGTCVEITLDRCQGGKCAPVKAANYHDFLYALMARQEAGYNMLSAYKGLYSKIKEKTKDKEETERADLKGKKVKFAPSEELEKLQAATKQLQGKLDSQITGKGYKAGAWNFPYYGLKAPQLHTSILKRIAFLQTIPWKKKAAADDKKVEKKKKKRRRRRRRRRRKKKKAEKPKENIFPLKMWGGILTGKKSWPQEALDTEGYKALALFYRLEALADRIVGRKGSLKYRTVALNYWSYLSTEQALHTCAKKNVKNKTIRVDITLILDTLSGRPTGKVTKLEVDPVYNKPEPEKGKKEEKKVISPAHKAIRNCILTALGKLSMRGVPTDNKTLEASYQVHLIP